MAPRKKGYTVFGVYEGNTEHRECIYVESAETGAAAERYVRELRPDLIIAGIVIGQIKSLDAGKPAPVVPLRGCTETRFAKISVTYVTIDMPHRCPQCKSNLTEDGALYQGSYHCQVAVGRIPRTSGLIGIAADVDIGGRNPVNVSTPTLVGAYVQCVNCNLLLWNGVKP